MRERFILRPSPVHGIGVFTIEKLVKGQRIDLSAGEKSVRRKSVPKEYQHLCVRDGKYWVTPPNFMKASVGWYINHSKTPNVVPSGLRYICLRNIKKNEELLVDYEHFRDDSVDDNWNPPA